MFWTVVKKFFRRLLSTAYYAVELGLMLFIEWQVWSRSSDYLPYMLFVGDLGLSVGLIWMIRIPFHKRSSPKVTDIVMKDTALVFAVAFIIWWVVSSHLWVFQIAAWQGIGFLDVLMSDLIHHEKRRRPAA